jgi:hypothetical protein
MDILADALLLGNTVPTVPSLGQICKGIAIARNDHRRVKSQEKFSQTIPLPSSIYLRRNVVDAIYVDLRP